MSRIDEELSRRFHRAERPVSTDVIERVDDRRRRGEARRRIGTVALALVVVAGTLGGIALLDRAFRLDGKAASQPSPANGPLVVSVWTDPFTGHRTAHLELVSADGASSRVLTPPGDGYDQYPAGSPDGRSVAYVHFGPDYESRVDAVLTVLDLITGEKRGLATGEISSASWSSDGTTIAFLGTLRGQTAIWTVPADGSGGPEPVVEDGSEQIEGRSLWGPPSWSPDGTALTFEVSDTPASDSPVRPPGVVTLDLVDGQISFLAPTDGDVVGSPAWSPDGTRIAFARTGGIWSVSPTGGDPVLIVGVTSEEFYSEGYDRSAGTPMSPVWSSDGTQLAYVRARTNEGTAVWVDALDGSVPVPVAGFGASAAWLPFNDAVTFTGDSPPAQVPEGTDIGLDRRLCDAERLGGIDFIGDGTAGAAWTGAFVKDDGTCPRDTFQTSIVAVDRTGDGEADAWSPLDYCLICYPFAALDLNADGRDELAVLAQQSSTPNFVLYGTDEREGSWGLYPLFVNPPGHPAAQLGAGDVVSFSTGGDEGYSGWVACEGYPTAPILVITWSDGIVEGDTKDVHMTRLRFDANADADVVGADDYTIPVTEPVQGVSDEPACGADFQLRY
jgi:dipeptidyl aminopeptidase/acylaminoacyl peptidase